MLFDPPTKREERHAKFGCIVMAVSIVLWCAALTWVVLGNATTETRMAFGWGALFPALMHWLMVGVRVWWYGGIFCQGCGHPSAPIDSFCRRCGTKFPDEPVAAK